MNNELQVKELISLYAMDYGGRGAYHGYRNLPAGLSKKRKLAKKRQKIARRKNRHQK